LFKPREISFESFAIAIEKIRKVYGKPDVGHSGYTGVLQQRGGLFYDIGSGTGKGVLAAAIAHEFASCIGIEVLEGLFVLSQDLLAAYNNKGKVKLSRDYDTCED
jgi:tRNA G46 methylase TrmB